MMVTAATVAVKLALVAPAGTTTVAGTVTALLLLLKSTVRPPAPAAAVSVTVQASDAAPVAEALAQVSEFRLPVATAVPVPERSTMMELPVVASLVIVKVPVAAPAALGLNCTVKPNVPPGLTLAGRLLWLLAEKYCPDTLICEIVTGADPLLLTEMFALEV